jgi:hypothetical protein
LALSDDQKAMLRLLAQREEGYEDMAALMGISVEELRARVKEALSEVEEPEAPAQPPAPATPPTPPPASPPAAQPPVAEPGPPAPEPVAAPAAPSPPAPPRQATRPSPLARLRGSKDRGALIGMGAGAAVVLVLVVVLVLGGGGSSSSTTTDGTTSLTAAEESKLTQAVLEPADGGDASGRALFGRYKKNVLLQVEAEGLDPSPPGETYTIWLYRSPKLVLRIGAVPVGEQDEGKLAVQLPIPAQVLSYVAGGAFDQVDVSLTSNAAYKAVLAKAKAERKLPPYTGESVLRGEITGPAIRKQ